MPTTVSPVTAAVSVLEHADGRAVTEVVVDREQRVLPGHYPGFPIFPGVCLVECVNLSAQAAPPVPGARMDLVGVKSTRFHSPVFPGDTVRSELTWEADGDAWLCRALLHTARGRVAQVRLRFDIVED